MYSRAQVISNSKLLWIENDTFAGWRCADCAWVFQPSTRITGATFEELKENFRSQLSNDFDSHVCVRRQKAKSAGFTQ
jgi:rubredoxin